MSCDLSTELGSSWPRWYFGEEAFCPWHPWLLPLKEMWSRQSQRRRTSWSWTPSWRSLKSCRCGAGNKILIGSLFIISSLCSDRGQLFSSSLYITSELTPFNSWLSPPTPSHHEFVSSAIPERPSCTLALNNSWPPFLCPSHCLYCSFSVRLKSSVCITKPPSSSPFLLFFLSPSMFCPFHPPTYPILVDTSSSSLLALGSREWTKSIKVVVLKSSIWTGCIGTYHLKMNA